MAYKRRRKPHEGRKYTDEQVKKIIAEFEEYIDATTIPIISEFCYTHDVLRDDLYNYEEFYPTMRRCIAKKEANLEKLSLIGQISTPQAIFSLKQLGWKDRQDVTTTGTIGVKIVDDIEESESADNSDD